MTLPEPLTQWAMDREIVLSRVIDAPRELVFSAWSNPQHLPSWFGPDGFTLETRELDLREGGRWRFDMIAPDGTRYTNRMVFTRMESPLRIEMEHGSDIDDDPGRFMVTIVFDEQSNGKTVITMRQLHPTREQRDAGVGFGAVEIGYQTLAKLAAFAEGLKG